MESIEKKVEGEPDRITEATAEETPEPKWLFYVLSFIVPIAGIVIGVIYFSKPDEEPRKFGKTCLIIAAMSVALCLLYILTIIILYVFIVFMVVAFYICILLLIIILAIFGAFSSAVSASVVGAMGLLTAVA
jgi:membrane-associated HD superfamily phosphohydrolase